MPPQQQPLRPRRPREGHPRAKTWAGSRSPWAADPGATPSSRETPSTTFRLEVGEEAVPEEGWEWGQPEHQDKEEWVGWE